MRAPELRRVRLARSMAAGAAAWVVAAAVCAEDAAYRFSAPIRIEQAAPFVRLALPPSAYAHSEQAELRDLRIVDAAGERVPFAVLAPRAARSEVQEQSRSAALYALPPRPAPGKAWPSPLEVTVQGDRISVRPARRAEPPAGTARSPGWLVDLGDARLRQPDEPTPRALRLVWSGPAEFSVGVDVEVSADLRQWRAAGSSQLLALASPSGALRQDRVILPANLSSPPARFVRLVWSETAAAPRLSAAESILDRPSSVTPDAPAEFVVAPLPAVQDDGPMKRALVFDLGGGLPLLEVELRLAGGTQIAPVRLQGRRSANDAWSELGSHVFYRIERSNQVSTAPPWALRTTQRYLRVIPDERAAALNPASTQLVVRAALDALVFARQGREPFTLQGGATEAKPSALPIQTLLPLLDEERPRFGQASLGSWSESEEVLRRIQSQQRLTAMRPWLLWAVLLAGVAGLGFMVWRLARGTAHSGSAV